jgi:phosphoglycerate dehydrogenase-like enzyme
MAKDIEILITLPFSEEQLVRLRNVSPRVHITTRVARNPDDISTDIWEKTEILYTDRVIPSPAQAPNLHWIQFHYAGIDFAIDSPIIQRENLLVTTLSGTASSQMAEYIVMMMLAMGHRLPEMIHAQEASQWPADRWERFSPLELRYATVGLVGYGSIARQTARLMQPFGCRILASKRDAMHPEDQGYNPPGMGDPTGDFFHRLYPGQALKSMLKECDFIVITLPLTAETRNLIGEEELKVCKPHAVIINPSRGEIIQQAALIKALQEHLIGGAALDVFDKEPLPAENPLWKLPNVIVTPHISGNSPHYNEKAMDFFVDNLNRYCNNQNLLNLFDRERGY